MGPHIPRNGNAIIARMRLLSRQRAALNNQKEDTMSDKSFVTIAKAHCPACQTQWETGTILMDQHLRERFNRTTVASVEVCPACIAKCEQEGYLAIICCDEHTDPNTRRVQRVPTGDGCLLKREAFAQIFDSPVPDGNIVLTDSQVMAHLRRLAEDAEKQEPEPTA